MKENEKRDYGKFVKYSFENVLKLMRNMKYDVN